MTFHICVALYCFKQSHWGGTRSTFGQMWRIYWGQWDVKIYDKGEGGAKNCPKRRDVIIEWPPLAKRNHLCKKLVNSAFLK